MEHFSRAMMHELHIQAHSPGCAIVVEDKETSTVWQTVHSGEGRPHFF